MELQKEGVRLSDLDTDALTDHGYPSDYAMDAVTYFQGTPHELVGLVQSLWRPHDLIDMKQMDDPRWGEPCMEVTFITGGWSGNEDLLSALSQNDFQHQTNFAWKYWESSHRGGKEVFRIPLDDWEKDKYLGCIFGEHTRDDVFNLLEEKRGVTRFDDTDEENRMYKNCPLFDAAYLP